MASTAIGGHNVRWPFPPYNPSICITYWPAGHDFHTPIKLNDTCCQIFQLSIRIHWHSLSDHHSYCSWHLYFKRFCVLRQVVTCHHPLFLSRFRQKDETQATTDANRVKSIFIAAFIDSHTIRHYLLIGCPKDIHWAEGHALRGQVQTASGHEHIAGQWCIQRNGW